MPSNVTFLAAISCHNQPTSYSQVVTDPQWQATMASEIAALEKNHAWTLTHLPPRKKPIGSKWVYKIKDHANGTIEHHKVLLVAKGCTQLKGLDYTETFSPIAKLTFVRCLLAVATAKNWELH